MKNKNLLILGASGKVGQLVVVMAKEKGYNITVVVRSKKSIGNTEGLNIIEGSVLNSEILKNAIQGQDVIISCLGIKRKSQNPWSPLVSPSDFTEMVIKRALPIMEKQNIKRIITISSAGVGDSWSKVSSLMKFLIKSSNVKYALDDFNKMEIALENSDIDSLSVRPVGLVDNDNTSSQVKKVKFFKMSSKISRNDVAKWMLDALLRENRFENSSEMIGW